MDVFRLRDRLIHDYADYVRSFVQIRDRRIDEFVQKSLRDEVLWPQPLIQLNPSFEPGGWVDDLVDRGSLHADCRKIFCIKTEQDPIGSRMLLHRHQVEAIEAGDAGAELRADHGHRFGQEPAYIIPIVDHVLRNGGRQGNQGDRRLPDERARATASTASSRSSCGIGYPDGQGAGPFRPLHRARRARRAADRDHRRTRRTSCSPTT